MKRGTGVVIAGLAASVLLAACATAGAQPGPTDTAAGSGLEGGLTIMAAASLQAPFDEIAAEFGRQNPDVTLNAVGYDGSATLATQLNEGAPADVFASADRANMDKVADLVAGEATVFARNTLEIAVQPGNPQGIGGIADLTAPGLQVVLCAPEVPCGSVARALLADAGLEVTPVSEEQNVTAVLTKVRSGDADAGLVYRTDVLGADGEVDGVPAEGAEAFRNEYLIAALADAENPEVAEAFAAFVLSEAGQRILRKHGFLEP